ncbi:protein-disulfide reductase DsbD family protein [Ensifer adhaerens]|uniref:protein-disulfide reductase DsbD domain-containing protein n=1 Tax=Ensifer adhaerens TaxID=106592 RepID=UPI0023A96462|nr:protein-disulfide reductase DsbD domain-containing protein [Ensifer adhaerens]WDZ77461.1 protein-disulfide reductase DsbD family protein [Ensifer adhaerens]
MIQRSTHQNMVQFIGAASLIAAFFLPVAAQAATSEWVTSPGGMIRLVAAQPRQDGTIPATLEVRLNAGWKTYWREPGASGIPPQVTIDPASDVKLEKIGFPVPKTFDDGVVRYVGYDKSVAFPLTLKRVQGAGDVNIRASVFLGICEDICIPVQGELTLTLKQGDFDNPLDSARIDDAVAALPEAPSKDFAVTASRYDDANAVLHLSVHLPDGADHPELFLAGPSGVSFGKPEITTEGETGLGAAVPVRLSGKDRELKGKPIVVTIRAKGRSMETTLAFD